jgi:hypothetical protein
MGTKREQFQALKKGVISRKNEAMLNLYSFPGRGY